MNEAPALRRLVPALLLAALTLGCASAAGERYAPGLGEIMSATQMRHLKLWLAAEAQNWDLAAYEVDELHGDGAIRKRQPRLDRLREKRRAVVPDQHRLPSSRPEAKARSLPRSPAVQTSHAPRDQRGAANR